MQYLLYIQPFDQGGYAQTFMQAGRLPGNDSEHYKALQINTSDGGSFENSGTLAMVEVSCCALCRLSLPMLTVTKKNDIHATTGSEVAYVTVYINDERERDEEGNAKATEIDLLLDKCLSGMRVPTGYFVAASQVVSSLQVSPGRVHGKLQLSILFIWCSFLFQEMRSCLFMVAERAR